MAIQPARRGSRSRAVARIYQKRGPAAVCILPALLFLLLFLVYPFARNIVDSFFEIRQLGAAPGDYIGWENYRQLIPGLEFTDPQMMTALRNTLLLVVCAVVFQVGLALVLALMVDRIRRGATVFRTLFFFPIVVSATALGLLFNLLILQNGPLNQIITALGGEPVVFREKYTFLTLAVPVIWQYVGFYFVILVTGLNNISDEVKEAALLDGATGWQTTRFITLPLLRGTLATCVTLSVTGALKVFDMPWVMFPPYFSDAYLTGTYMYYQAFDAGNVDYAAAIAVCIVFLGIVLSQLSRLLFRERHE